MKEIFLPNLDVAEKEVVTVIIPTLMKADIHVFAHNLRWLNECEYVKKIVVIDNTELKTFNTFRMKKVKAIKEPVNYWVNPAWNRGMQEVNTPYYLLLNDDVLVHPSVLKEAINGLKETSVDLLFVHNTQEKLETYEKQVPKENGVVWIKWIENKPMAELSGCFIMGRKSKWVDIPNEMKIFCGDNWILENNREHAGIIKSTYICHYAATTAKDYYNTTLITDNEAYQHLTKIK